jgi:hypothetical protein
MWISAWQLQGSLLSCSCGVSVDSSDDMMFLHVALPAVHDLAEFMILLLACSKLLLLLFGVT